MKLEIASIYGVKTKQGLVELELGSEKIQMDISKAREVRAMLDGAIEAAVTDGLLMQYFTQKVNMDMEEAAAMLLEFRELRQGSKGTVYPQ